MSIRIFWNNCKCSWCFNNKIWCWNPFWNLKIWQNIKENRDYSKRTSLNSFWAIFLASLNDLLTIKISTSDAASEFSAFVVSLSSAGIETKQEIKETSHILEPYCNVPDRGNAFVIFRLILWQLQNVLGSILPWMNCFSCPQTGHSSFSWSVPIWREEEAKGLMWKRQKTPIPKILNKFWLWQ